MNDTICIYHNNCADGFGAAWAVYKALGNSVLFYPANYNDPPPDVKGKSVIIVDFSYRRDVLLKMAQEANAILIIDHHKTAQEDLKDIENAVALENRCSIRCIFDMSYSGAMLTWQYFFPGKVPPKLLQHIQDRDLWLFELNGTREVSAALFSYSYDFELWDNLMQMDVKQLLSDGTAIERKMFKDIVEFVTAASYRMDILSINVPVLNCPYIYASDAGHIMGIGEAFAATYFYNGKEYVFSLRSNKDDSNSMDVSEIAKFFGGGGHKHAAGFKIISLGQLNAKSLLENV